MEANFEIEIWPDSKKLKKILLSITLITIVAWMSCLIGKIYWNDYVETVITLQRKTKYVGWPVKFYYYGMLIGIAGIISFAFILLTKDNKHPVLALNKNGLYINQQLIKQTMVEWANIKHIELKNEEKSKTIEIYFHDPNKIIETQSNAKRPFLKENLKDNKPLLCSDKYVKGNLGLFYEKSKQMIKP